MMAHAKDVFNNETQQRNPEFFTRNQYGELVGNDTIYTSFTHRIEDMLLPSSLFHSCSINGKACGPKDFTSFFSSVYGLCYTFNSGLDGHPLIKATLAGPLTGLELLLNVERDSYLDNPLTLTVPSWSSIVLLFRLGTVLSARSKGNRYEDNARLAFNLTIYTALYLEEHCPQ